VSKHSLTMVSYFHINTNHIQIIHTLLADHFDDTLTMFIF